MPINPQSLKFNVHNKTSFDNENENFVRERFSPVENPRKLSADVQCSNGTRKNPYAVTSTQLFSKRSPARRLPNGAYRTRA